MWDTKVLPAPGLLLSNWPLTSLEVINYLKCWSMQHHIMVIYLICILCHCFPVYVKENVLGGREGEIETEWMSSCGNISNIYSPPLSAVAWAFEEQSNIRRWSEDSPFKPQGFIWERIPSVHRICSHFIWIHLFLRWKREERGSEKK